MKKLINLCCQVVIPIILISCINDENNCDANHKLLDSDIVKSIRFSVDSLQYDYESVFLLQNNPSVIGAYDAAKHRINYFDLKLGEHVGSTVLNNEGPHKVLNPSAFYFHNSDSIFVAQYGYHQIYLINDKGEKLDTYSFINSAIPDSLMEGREVTGVSGLYGVGGFDKYGMKLFFDDTNQLLISHFYPIVLDQENSFPTTYNLPVVASYSVKNKRLNSLVGEYPETYLQNDIPHDLFFPYTYNKKNNNLTISFPSSNKIYVKEITSGKEYFECVKGKNFQTSSIPLYSQKDGGEVSDFWNDYERKSGYVNMIYDKYRDIYLRIYSYGHSSVADDKNAKLFNSKWSIIVLDNAFQVIGEVTFPDSYYNFFQIIPTENGILLSKSNLFRTDFNEDFLEFDLINLALST